MMQKLPGKITTNEESFMIVHERNDPTALLLLSA